MLYCVWLYVNCAKNICECEDALVTNKLSRRNTFHSPKVCCIFPWMQLHKNPMYVINFIEKAVFTYFLSWQKLYNHGVCVIVYFAYSSHSIYFLSPFFPKIIWIQTYNTNFRRTSYLAIYLSCYWMLLKAHLFMHTCIIQRYKE